MAATPPLKKKIRAKFQTLLLFGPPGTGKGTWGKLLGGMPGFAHISSGDLFRNMNAGSNIGSLCMSYILKGELVPDDITVDLWLEHMDHLIESNKFNPQKSYLLLDGLPRSLPQAKRIDPYVDVKVILALTCDDPQILFSRLRGRALIEHRHDDANEETLRRRFEVYSQQTREVLSYYPQNLISRVNVAQPVTRILHQISSALVSKLSPAERGA